MPNPKNDYETTDLFNFVKYECKTNDSCDIEKLSKKIDYLIEKVEFIENKIQLIFGNYVLIRNRFINIGKDLLNR
jgi:hypothetical protein